MPKTLSDSLFSDPSRQAPVKNAALGVGQQNPKGHTVLSETLRTDGTVAQRILQRPGNDGFYRAQTKINAFNFPFTGGPGAGCFYQCRYCYLRQPFFARHITAGTDHGREMNFTPGWVEGTRRFLAKNRDLPQYMKRVQIGVSTEVFMPQMQAHTRPDLVLREFQRAAAEGNVWMVHLVTKSPTVLDYAELLAEMREQVQVEVSFVTMDEEASRLFETGTPSVARRLKIVETLATKGVFVRMMLMPVLREYELVDVAGNREIVFVEVASGRRMPGRKRQGRVDGNFGAGEVEIEVFDGRRWVAAEAGEIWKPVIVRDWSKLDEARRRFAETGAKAYKQKDLNYFYVDELLAAQREDRAPRPERGRSEDPTAETLIHSGETVRDADGKESFADVLGYHVPKSEWTNRQPPRLRRRVMDFGYSLHSPIVWGDCV